MKNKKHIAMRCNKEQFEAIKPKLEKANVNMFMIFPFKKDYYLCLVKEGTVTNGTISDRTYFDEIHEQWDEKIFLEARGIEITPKFEITKETVIKYQMKDEFPEVFEVKLEFGKWYKHELKGHNDMLFNFQGKYSVNCDSKAYGFTRNGDWHGNLGVSKEVNYTEATPEEVTESLKKEAVSRGFITGVSFLECKRQSGSQGSLSMCNGNFYFKRYEDGEEVLISGGRALFCNGQWATIIQTKTIQQAEELLKELGHEIKIVS